MENIVTVIFRVGSQGYQAFSDMKRNPYNADYLMSEIVLVKKERGLIVIQDSFDTGIRTADDTVMGGLIGGLVGVIGGPIGMLFGGSVGALAGSAVDLDDMARHASLAERVTGSMKDGDLALIFLVQETDEKALDSRFKGFDAVIIRRDAATVQDEIKEAERVQKELEKQAKKELRAQQSAERKAKIETQRERIKQRFDEFKKKHPGWAGAK